MQHTIYEYMAKWYSQAATSSSTLTFSNRSCTLGTGIPVLNDMRDIFFIHGDEIAVAQNGLDEVEVVSMRD
jgi:hypothetical protein